jgi:hypothetical protein
MHARVTGQDLLDQGRAGAWHPENENRRLGWVAPVLCALEVSPIEAVDQTVNIPDIAWILKTTSLRRLPFR